MRARLIALVSAIGVVAAAVTALPASPAAAAPLSRPADPVVLTGADLPTLSGDARGTIVGFRWTGTAWAQLPIQIDERAVVNFGKIYNDPAAVFYSSQPGLVNELVYTATNTWTGRDPNGKFDNDDELVFMARDAGAQAPGGSQPTGTVAGSGVEVHVTDPTSVGSEGFVYLFHRAKGFSLPQAAKTRYVTYGFKLLSGNYKNTYNRVDGPNPENSLVKGATYRYHFSDRWLSDSLQVTAPGRHGCRHPRTPQGTVRAGRVRSQRRHVQRRRRRVRHQQERARARHSFLHRRQQWAEHATHPLLLRPPPRHPHRPAGARHPVGDGLHGLQLRRRSA